MKLRYLFSIIKMMRIPGMFKVFKDMKSYIRFNFVHAALESGLLLALAEPQSKNTLMQTLKVERPEILDAILDVGVSIGELSLKNGLYQLKGRISKTVITDKGEAVGALIQANATYYNSAYRELADRMKGGPLSDNLANIGALVAILAKIQEPLIEDFIHYTVKGDKPTNILEIGCGSGAFMKTAFNVNKNTTGIGIDFDGAVVEQAKSNMEKWGLSSHFNILQGDIRTFNFDDYEDFDLITLYNLIYYFTIEERYQLIKKLKSNLSPKGKIAVVIAVQSKYKDPTSANLNLANCSLEGLTPLPELNSLEKLFKDSGLHTVEINRIIPGGSLYSILAS